MTPDETHTNLVELNTAGRYDNVSVKDTLLASYGPQKGEFCVYNPHDHSGDPDFVLDTDENSTLTLSTAERYGNVFLGDTLVASYDRQTAEFCVYNPHDNSEDPAFVYSIPHTSSETHSDSHVSRFECYQWADQEWAQVISCDRDTNTLRLFDPRTHDEWDVPLDEFERDIATGTITRVTLETKPIESNTH